MNGTEILASLHADLQLQWTALCDNQLVGTPAPCTVLPQYTMSNPQYQALIRLNLRPDAKVELFEEVFEGPICEIPRIGDIVVGIRLFSPTMKKNTIKTGWPSFFRGCMRSEEEDDEHEFTPHVSSMCQITVMIDQTEVISDYTLTDSVRNLLLAGEGSFIPHVAMPHYSIRVKGIPVGTKVCIVYGLLDIYTRKWFSKEPMMYFQPSYEKEEAICMSRGVCVRRPITELHSSAYEIPKLEPEYLRCMRKKQEWMEIIEEELITRTWHPSRLGWCLDLDEVGLLQ